MNLTDELRFASDDSHRPQTLDLVAVTARGRSRKRLRRLAMLGSAAAVVVVAVASVGLLRTTLAPGGSSTNDPDASCAAVIDLDGHRYFGHGDLLTTPRTTERTATAVRPGCDDGNGAVGPEHVTARELVGVAMTTAVLVDGVLYLEEGAELTAEMRAWFRYPTCSHEGSVTLVGRWIGVTSDKPVRFDGDVRAPLRIEYAVERSTPDVPAYDGWRIHVRDDGSARPALTPDDVKAALWDDAPLEVRVHCDGKAFMAESFRVLR